MGARNRDETKQPETIWLAENIKKKVKDSGLSRYQYLRSIGFADYLVYQKSRKKDGTVSVYERRHMMMSCQVTTLIKGTRGISFPDGIRLAVRSGMDLNELKKIVFSNRK